MAGDSKRQTSAAWGTVLLMAGQVVFLMAGYAVNIMLATGLEDRDYSIYAIVLPTLVWIELFVINGIPTVMQRFLPAGTWPEQALISLGRRSQVIYCLAVFALFYAGAPWIAAALADPELTPYLRIAAPDILLYGLYWLYTGILSGRKQFSDQAVAVMTYALGKVTGVAVLLWLGYGVKGALIGNWIGSLAGLLLASWRARQVTAVLEKAARLAFSKIRSFAVPVVLFTITVNLLLSIDIFFVKRLLSGQDVSWYYNVSTLARIPYIVFLGLSFTLLPVLSGAISSGDEQGSREQIRQVFRFMLILLMPVVVFLAQNASASLLLIYPAKFEPGAAILPWLAGALTIFTFFYIAATIINADNRPGLALATALVAVVVDIAANMVLVPKYGTIGAAASTGLAACAGLLAGSLYVLRRFGALLSWRALTRVTLAIGVTGIAMQYWAATPATVLPKAVVFFLIYAGALFITGELRPEEILSLLRKKQVQTA